MLPPRRCLPSLSSLSAFEAAARTGSITRAAIELGLTQSAVSRQIKSLEEQLGASLFVRERQTIRLTLAGEGYAREIREGLRRISTASLNLRTNPKGGTLTVAILPTFGTRWLAPRLPAFLAVNPGITVNLVTRLYPFDFRSDSIDAAIHFGNGTWPGAELTFLMSERTAPICSPAFLARHTLNKAEDFLSVPLLHLTTRHDAWNKWFISHGCTPQGSQGMLFDQFSIAAQAAAAGLGVGLLPTFLIESELKRGELVPAFSKAIESEEKYYLACPIERLQYPPLIGFRNWIDEAASSSVA